MDEIFISERMEPDVEKLAILLLKHRKLTEKIFELMCEIPLETYESEDFLKVFSNGEPEKILDVLEVMEDDLLSDPTYFIGEGEIPVIEFYERLEV